MVDTTIRLFFALVPPSSLQRALGELAREVARQAHGRPVPADNLHVTLAFVGAWPVARLQSLTDAGASVRAAPMRITLDTLGCFRRAGIAWLAPSEPPAALSNLAVAVAGQLSQAGVSLDERPFHPHVTLARRCRGPYPHEAAGPFAWDIDCLALMQSDTRAEGARYRLIARWMFGGAD